MQRIFIALFLMLLLSGCTAVRTSMIAGTQSPSVNNQYQGVLYVEFGTLSDARPVMQRECQYYGGLNEVSIINRTPPGVVASINSMGGTYWFYKCNGVSIQNQIIPKSNSETLSPRNDAPLVDNKITVEAARKKCSDLGFKAGTERFGECVLRLLR